MLDISAQVYFVPFVWGWGFFFAFVLGVGFGILASSSWSMSNISMPSWPERHWATRALAIGIAMILCAIPSFFVSGANTPGVVWPWAIVLAGIVAASWLHDRLLSISSRRAERALIPLHR